MTNISKKSNPVAGLTQHAGPIATMPNGTFGWISPHQLHRDGEHLFIQRDTNLVGEMSAAATLLVRKVDDEVHVHDEHVFMTNRWWNYPHHDTYTYPHDYGIYVRSLVRGPEKHRDEAPHGRIIGNCAWGTEHGRFAGPLSSMPIGSFGFIDMKQFYRNGNSVHIAEGARVYPCLEGETCLQVIRFHDGYFVFDGDVPEVSRWWNRNHPVGGPRDGWNTHVRGLMREHEWHRRFGRNVA